MPMPKIEGLLRTSATVARQVFTVVVNNHRLGTSEEYEFDSYIAASTMWNGVSSASPGHLSGGISIKEFSETGVVLRDGWLLHVHENGHVFVSRSQISE